MSDRRVMTEYGPGVVVASETVRGLTSYKVEGPGFSVWLTAQQVPEFGQLEWETTEDTTWDNSTTLPYNPKPQFPAINTGESTIQPNQHIDPDERLTPADSVSFEESPETGPGPSRDLFASAVPEAPEARTSQYQRYLDRFADVDPVVDRTSLQARLDEDPARVVNEIRMANWERSNGIDDRLRQAFILEENDSHVRTAAWADVRKKAIRLRRGGSVQVEAANPSAIVATVTGDHGIYDVAVLRGNILTGSTAITEWSCSCPWGDWAFERQHTFVGRLCSHAYASYLELQSLTQRKDKPYGWSDKTSAVRTAVTFGMGEQVTRKVALQVGDRVMTNYGDEAIVVEYPEVLGDREDPDYAVVQFDDGSEEALHATQEIRPIATTSARYPREDGRLSTDPGTLTPDLHHIPKIRHLDRVDVTEDERVDITRTSAIESIHPNGWGTEVETLLNKLKDLWAEEDRPGRNQQRIDEIRDVTDELHELGFDSSGVATAMRQAGIYDWNMEDFLVQAFLGEPFAGSGPVDKDGYGTSAERLLGDVYDDVDGPGDNPAEMNADDLMPRGASRTAADEYFEDGDYLDGETAPGEEGDDVLAYLMDGSGGGDTEFAAFQARLAAELEEEKQANLRTAGRQFTLAEQQALMDEEPADGVPLGLDELDLRGTHYLS